MRHGYLSSSYNIEGDEYLGNRYYEGLQEGSK